jgi:hypothetical protein
MGTTEVCSHNRGILRATERKGLENSIIFRRLALFVTGRGLATLLVVTVPNIAGRGWRRRSSELVVVPIQMLESVIVERKQATSQIRQLQNMEAVGQPTSSRIQQHAAIALGSSGYRLFFRL